MTSKQAKTAFIIIIAFFVISSLLVLHICHIRSLGALEQRMRTVEIVTEIDDHVRKWTIIWSSGAREEIEGVTLQQALQDRSIGTARLGNIDSIVEHQDRPENYELKPGDSLSLFGHRIKSVPEEEQDETEGNVENPEL